MSLSQYLTVQLEKKISIIALGNLDKSPPIFKKGASYQKLEEQFRSLSITLTLSENAEDAVLEMVTDNIYNEEGVNNIIS